jgi:hypothetical protein
MFNIGSISLLLVGQESFLNLINNVLSQQEVAFLMKEMLYNKQEEKNMRPESLAQALQKTRLSKIYS